MTEGAETEPEKTDSERKDAKKSMVSGVLVRLVAMSVAIVFSVYLLTNGDISGGPKRLIDFIVPPVAVCIVILTVASVLNVVFRGEIASSVSVSLTEMALIVFIAMVMMSLSERSPDEEVKEIITAFIALIVAAGVAVAVYMSVKKMTETGGKILSSAAILALALLIVVVFRGILPDVLLTVVFIIMASVAIFGLVSLLKRHRNPELKKTGDYFESPTVRAIIVVCILIVTLYVMWIRPRILETDSKSASAVQWIVICLVLGLCGLAMAIYLKGRSPDLKPETWGKKINDVASLDPDLTAASGIIDEFVKTGRKERLIVTLTAIMLSNGVSEAAAGKILERIVRYRDPEVLMIPVPSYVDIHAEASEERGEIVYLTLKEVASEMHAMRVFDDDDFYASEEGF